MVRTDRKSTIYHIRAETTNNSSTIHRLKRRCVHINLNRCLIIIYHYLSLIESAIGRRTAFHTGSSDESRLRNTQSPKAEKEKREVEQHTECELYITRRSHVSDAAEQEVTQHDNQHPRHQQTGQPADTGQHQVFGQHLRHQRTRTGPKRLSSAPSLRCVPASAKR